MADLTTRTTIPAEVNNFYDRVLLTRAVPAFIHNRYAQVRDIPSKSGTDTIKFRRYGNLTAQTTALTEGVTPAGKQLSSTELTAQVLYYGDYVTLTDKLTIETIDAILVETAEILGDQVGDSLDQLCRDIIVAGTTVQYASTATARNEVAAAMKINRAEVKEAVRTLKGGEAKPLMTMVNPSTGFNTTPIGRTYVGIVHPDTTFDLDDATGWIPVEKYPNRSNIMDNEVGALSNVRFVETTNAKVFSSSGSGSIDVYATLIFGKEAYAMTRISGNALRNIIKPLGSAGSADPLDQRQTSGWKATYVARILNQAWILRIEHSVSS